MRKRFTFILGVLLIGVLAAAASPTVGLFHTTARAASAAAQGHGGFKSTRHTSVGTARTINESKVPQETKAQAAAAAKARPLPLRGDQKRFAAEKAKSAQTHNQPVAPGVQTAAPQRAGSTSANTPGALQAFQGMADSGAICPYFGGGCAPPDMAIAANDNYVVQGVNTSIAVYNAKTGAIIAGWPKTFQNFLGVPNPAPGSCGAPNGAFLSDPRLFYEPNKQRFWFAAIEIEGAFGVNTCNYVSDVWVAISATNNPTGGWFVYAFPTSPGSGFTNDYTQIGLDSSGFYYDVNLYDITGSTFEEAEFAAMPKRLMEAGAGFGYSIFTGPFWCNVVCINVDTVHPVMTETMNTGPRGEVLISLWNDCSGCNTASTRGDPEGNDCNVNACTGGVAWLVSGVDSPGGVVVVTESRFSGGWAELLPPGGDVPGCVGCLETLDSRISGTPVYSSGWVLYAFETRFNNGTQNVPGIAVEQLQIGMTDQNAGCAVNNCASIDGANTFLLQSADQVYGGDGDASFGALMPNNNGDWIMVFEFNSGSADPGVAYVARRATFHPLGFHDSGIYLSGGACANTGRWGDYEAASYTGFFKDQIWIAGEYATAGCDWATAIGRLNFTSIYQP
jgi:hypothetical protein